jgi:hypothetical protein
MTDGHSSVTEKAEVGGSLTGVWDKGMSDWFERKRYRGWGTEPFSTVPKWMIWLDGERLSARE